MEEQRVLAGPMCRRPPAFPSAPALSTRAPTYTPIRPQFSKMHGRKTSKYKQPSKFAALSVGPAAKNHHGLRIELLGRLGRAIPHPSPLERAPEQFHLYREERYYLVRQRRHSNSLPSAIPSPSTKTAYRSSRAPTPRSRRVLRASASTTASTPTGVDSV